MKESEKIYNECLKILKDLEQCVSENGWKGKILGSCLEYEKLLNQCKIRQFEAKRKENRGDPVKLKKF